MSETSDPTAETEKASLPRLLGVAHQQLWTTLVSVPLLTLVCGVGYPLVLAVIARPLFPHQSGGSLVSQRDRVVGSTLIGQAFFGADYFHPRPSAAGDGYDALSSGGTNLGPSNPKLYDGSSGGPSDGAEIFPGARQLTVAYRYQNDLAPDSAVPIDAITRSGSGLDPHISPENARLQARRIARVRGLGEENILRLIADATQARQLGFLGEPRVSVLELNLALDRTAPPVAAASAR